MSENKKLIGIFIDALRPDFISKEHTPFIYNLTKNNYYNELETILGYSDSIDASIFTGTYPDRHGYWMKYQYNPANSPFKNLKIIKPLSTIDYIPSNFIKSGINFTLYNTLYRKISKDLGYDGLASYNIPYKLLENFDITLKKSQFDLGVFNPIMTLFDVLESNGKTHYYSHGIKQDTFERIKQSDMGIIYLSDIDFYAHIFGLQSAIFYRALHKLDNKVQRIYETCKTSEPYANIILFADHGMADVHKILTFKELRKHPGFGKRFLYALDGTMVRFWYFDDSIQSIIHDYFSDLPYGHFLTNDEQKTLRIKFSHNRYGDDIYLLKQGFSIFPNYMSWNTPKAMHAYHPSYNEQKGAVILSGDKFNMSGNKSPVKLADIMPTILDVLGIDIPETVEGVSRCS